MIVKEVPLQLLKPSAKDFAMWLKRFVNKMPRSKQGLRLRASFHDNPDQPPRLVVVNAIRSYIAEKDDQGIAKKIGSDFFNSAIYFDILPSIGSGIDVTAVCTDDAAKEQFDSIVAEIGRRSAITLQSQSGDKDKIKSKGGRPRNPEYDWALHEVRVKNRSPEDVYPEWLERIGDRGKALANARDSFNKAIRRDRKKE